MKLVCCYCIITYKNHNPTTLHDKHVIKLKRNIDIDGIELDKEIYFICTACKQVIKMNKAHIF